MITTLLITSIINVLLSSYLLFKSFKLFFEIKKLKSEFFKSFLGYEISLYKKTSEYSYKLIFGFNIPLRNFTKVNNEEEIQLLLSKSEHTKLSALRTKFSWLKTEKEVDEFVKKYSVVDERFVDELYRNWKTVNRK